MKNADSTAQSPAIILLTRIPEPGSGKRRLSPLLSEGERVALQEAMIADEYRTMKKSCENVLVFCAPFEKAHAISEIVGEDATLLAQEGPGLGEQMENAFNEAFRRGFSPCLLAGSDIPGLSSEDFAQAFSLLEDNDAVIAPTRDGGYCVIGLKRPCSAPFAGIEYSTDSVFENTCGKIRKAGLSLGFMQAQMDLDTPNDLREFAQGPDRPQCPATNAVLRRLIEANA